MNAATEDDFDQLPEALRLALFDHARRELAEKIGEPVAVNLAQLSEATSIGRGTVHNRYRVALLKLRHAANERGL